MGKETEKYDKTDAARDTNSSTGKVSEAWHDARDHAVEDNMLERGSGNRGDFHKGDHADRAESFWKSIFG